MLATLRALGWTMMLAGLLLGLYVVYLVWFTGVMTSRAQAELGEQWRSQVAASSEGSGAATSPDGGAVPDERPAVDGDAYAVLWFERDGEKVVNDDVLYVVEGVNDAHLRNGPGRYPDGAVAGGPGNFAIAGHRTTYGAPFWSLDTLEDGDTIHVIDRSGIEWVYAYRRQQVVAPTDLWVVGEDPLGRGAKTITLTTCHPRTSNTQRLVAWGELTDVKLAG